jgi:starch phosphorylase
MARNSALGEQPRVGTHPGSNGRTSTTVEGFKRALVDNLYYIRGQGAQTAGPDDIYAALAYTVRDHLMERWRKTTDFYAQERPKFVYYLSAEYLLGRQLTQNMLYTETTGLARQALAEYGYDLDALIELEPEPGLGNGGLGRLAACFLDSMATLGIPCVGYGIRYEFGIFKQTFRDGWQAESPDEWLYYGNPWEFEQPDRLVHVAFGGHTVHDRDERGRARVRWVPAETVLGEPYHTLVPGFRSDTVNMLRLWRARASQEFNFQLFDGGDYTRAVEEKIRSENITKVLYPNDNTLQGRELRLRQQYFFVACSINDIIRRFLAFHDDWSRFPETAVIQLNDTHPVIAIAELMRVLLDDYRLVWDEAWAITSRSFGYTLHTLLPEALEKWPVHLLERILPRHLEIIYEINQRMLDEVAARYPGDLARIARMSIIEEGPERLVRMAHLGAAGSFALNGVSELQSGLLKERTLRDFHELWPGKFTNVTNGVTPRRFMRLANPRLAELITPLIGDGWLTDLEELRRLEPFAEQPEFRRAWMAVKRANKTALVEAIDRWTGIRVAPDSLFDMMVKRLHEFKRNLLKTLHIITLYNRLVAEPGLDLLPRTFIFAAKAAPGYHMAKLIIKLTNSVAEVVNDDPAVAGRLRVVFVPNFNVTVGEWLYPAADVSEQISLAGKEASGTGNMKFALNGALTVGTLDGANIEIREQVGAGNFFLFGLSAPEAFALKERGYRPREYYERDPELRAALDSIAGGRFSRGDAQLFRPIVDSLLNYDEYMLLADYPAYIQCQDVVDAAYRDQGRWARMSILNVARCGYFSSDRSIRQYADEIWRVAPVG